MTDERRPPNDADDELPADPFEADLVAYLDGELDPESSRQVEARLASDPEARLRAAALKKTFDLLDYLPQPQPTPDFTHRTLERIPALRSEPAASSGPATAGPDETQSPHDPTNRPLHTSAAETESWPRLDEPVRSLPAGRTPAPRLTGSTPSRWLERLKRHRWLHRWLRAALVLVAAGSCATGGYLAVAERLRPASRPEPVVTVPEELPITDHRVVTLLPLYAGVDDLAFARQLAEPEWFGEHPAVSPDSDVKVPQLEPEVPTGRSFEALAAAFKQLPPARQQAIRELDRQLHSLDEPTRDQLLRVLELYAVWLDRLEPTRRQAVFAAPTPARRLEVIRQVLTEQWLESLPLPLRTEYGKLPAPELAERLRQWRDDELARREEWSLVRRHAEDIAANKLPWPFDSPTRQKEVIEFVRTAFRTDEPKRSRLNPFELEAYNRVLALADKQGGWWWYGYGKTVYDLTRKYEVFLLPEPAKGEPVIGYAQLGAAARHFEKGKARMLTQPHLGRWPDFALAVHNYAVTEKAERIVLPPLGPARPDEFREPLRSFIRNELIPALTPAQLRELQSAEGKWPDYPREVIRLSKQADLSAPGLMLPGPPKRWETMYGRFPGFRP